MRSTITRVRKRRSTREFGFTPPSIALSADLLIFAHSCTLCYSDEGAPPKAPVVALGTRVYLALMENEELVPGHCRIVPVQHYLSCLEIDEEEGWDEIKVRLALLRLSSAAAVRNSKLI